MAEPQAPTEKKLNGALAGMAQWLEHRTVHLRIYNLG